MRTLIISDAHGYPQLIENALKHARFRPGLLPGVRQVVGHSPRQPSMDDLDFYMIDPGVYSGLGDPRRYRYAVIDQGQVRVEEGVLGRPTPAAARGR